MDYQLPVRLKPAASRWSCTCAAAVRLFYNHNPKLEVDLSAIPFGTVVGDRALEILEIRIQIP